jgi:hypothetical protein
MSLQIFEHILIHGDIRKTTKMQVAGEELQVETFVEEEDEDTVKHSTKELANRASFVAMAKDLKQKVQRMRKHVFLSLTSSCQMIYTTVRTYTFKLEVKLRGRSIMSAYLDLTLTALNSYHRCFYCPYPQGVDVRMSMEPGDEDVEGGQPGGLEPGRVILAVVDMSMVDYFRMQVRG